MEKITKKNLAEVLAEKFDLTKKDANEIITVIFDEIHQFGYFCKPIKK